jgi:hypothetical protein
MFLVQEICICIKWTSRCNMQNYEVQVWKMCKFPFMCVCNVGIVETGSLYYGSTTFSNVIVVSGMYPYAREAVSIWT